MPRDWKPDDDDLDDDEFQVADEELEAEGEENRLMECPHCGSSIWDESEQCPRCGTYLEGSDAPPQRRPLWIGLGVAFCLMVFLLWIFGGTLGLR